MTEGSTSSRGVDLRIPLFMIVPLVLITLVMWWGFKQYKHEEALKGEIPIPAGVESVRLVFDVGNVDIVLGSPGKIKYFGKTMRAAGSQEELDRALAVPFDLEPVEKKGEKVLELRVSEMPDGFVRLPPPKGAEKDQTSPRLFREMNIRVEVPADLAFAVVASKANIRIDTRQAETDITLEEGDLVLMNMNAGLRAKNGKGSIMLSAHRGPLEIQTNGLVNATFVDVVGPVSIENEDGQITLNLPRHSSVDVEAVAHTGGVRNAFGLKVETLLEGQKAQGKLNEGKHKVRLSTKKRSITIDEVKEPS